MLKILQWRQNLSAHPHIFVGKLLLIRLCFWFQSLLISVIRKHNHPRLIRREAARKNYLWSGCLLINNQSYLGQKINDYPILATETNIYWLHFMSDALLYIITTTLQKRYILILQMKKLRLSNILSNMPKVITMLEPKTLRFLSQHTFPLFYTVFTTVEEYRG